MKKKIQPDLALIPRLSGYAAAGALVALLPDTNAQVEYSGIQNLELNFPEDSIAIDLDTNMVNDFIFQLYGNSYSSASGSYFSRSRVGYGVIFNPNSDLYKNSWITRATSVLLYSSTYDSYTIQAPIADGLELGEMIDSSIKSWSNYGEPYWPGVLGITYYEAYNGPGGFESFGWNAGDFKGEEKFIGVRFYIGDQQHYGWIRVSMGDDIDPMTIVDWAYETTPDERILAGEGMGIDLPPHMRMMGPDNFTNVATQTLNITVPEEITGFDISDIVVTNGSADNFAAVTEGWEYTVDVTAAGEGLTMVDIPDSAVYDLAGIANLASSKSWVYDITVPHAQFEYYFSGGSQLFINITFTEHIEGFEFTELVISGGTADAFEIEEPGTEYSFFINMTSESVSIELPAGAVSDLAGNLNNRTIQEITVDNTGPVVTLDAGVTTTSEASVEVDVSFDELTYNFDPGDFVIANGSITSSSTITDYENYSITVTAATAGEVVVALPAESVFDASDNGNGMTSISWIYQPLSLDPSSDEEVMIFPNPVRDNLQIKLNREATLKIIDLSGNVVYVKEHALNEIIDVISFNPGIYIVRIQDDKKVKQYKIIIE